MKLEIRRPILNFEGPVLRIPRRVVIPAKAGTPSHKAELSSCLISLTTLRGNLDFVISSFKTGLGISTFLILLLFAMFSSTSLAQSPLLKIGLIADIQYCDCPTAGAREYSKSLVKLDEAIRMINSEKVDFTVELGDMIDRDFVSFDPVYKKLNALKSRWIFVPGNHDFNVADTLKKKVWRMIPAKKGYWSEVIGDVRLVYLNGFQNSVIAYRPSSDWNGGLGKKQLEWAKDQVLEANLSKQLLIVFGHQPIIPGEAHSMWDSQKLIDILAGSSQQVLYLCGHKHSGGDQTISNIRVMNLKGMVEQPLPSFGILSIYADRYVIQGYGDQGSAQGQWK